VQGYKTTDGYRLGQWVAVQRSSFDSLSAEFKARLEALPGWSWNPHTDKWEEGFRYLTEFANREGHTRLAAKYKASDGYRLGQWVAIQRRKRDSMPTERTARLEAIPGWVWNVIEAQWEDGFRYLREFVGREGHCMVLTGYKAADSFRLGQWVSAQRANRDSLTPERIARLEELPDWIWDAISAQWEDGFRHLQEFVGREGHAKVNDDYRMADGFQLGNWIGRQRSTRNNLPLDRKARLESLPGWSWDARADRWEDGFRHLMEFVTRTGYCRVVGGYKAADGYPIGQWVTQQRSKPDRLSAEFKTRLEALPGWSWKPYADKWEEGFRYLTEFANREGHTRLAAKYKASDGYSLGQWVAVQRRSFDSMSPEHKARLEALPGWVWRVK